MLKLRSRYLEAKASQASLVVVNAMPCALNSMNFCDCAAGANGQLIALCCQQLWIQPRLEGSSVFLRLSVF